MSSYSPAPRCTAVHSRFQPGDSEWTCPNCNAGYPRFAIETPAPDAAKKCHKLHVDYDVVCTGCNSQWNGQEVINLIKAKRHLSTCPLCHGKGAVTE